ncbi:MAG TPA: hypothetical protein PK429_00785 [Candidatus Pacearchaeota archaeon]|jgi:hypothetical protein|nr:MAG: hypothetical protein YFSK_5960 [Candidatus Yanofskybacteria bacterium]HNR80892.1 hypothetical protein [Candidatus Pacearchaeota archaeon]HPO06483.1 hypothetical protein [Candidatus Pacearchaeota archaeon]
MEKFSSIDGIIGDVGPEGEEEVKECFAYRFKKQNYEGLSEVEKRKTSEESATVQLANQLTNEILRRHDCGIFDIPEQNIHIIKEECWQDEENEATYFWDLQAIGIKERKSAASLLEITMHEMMHMKVRNFVQVPIGLEKSLTNVKAFSNGLNVINRGGGKEYFENLNEAVIEEMVKKEILEYIDSEISDQEIAETKRIKGGLLSGSLKHDLAKNREDIEDILYASCDESGRIKEVDFFCYHKSRKMLDILINKIFQNKENLEANNKNEFNIKAREDVFNVFAEATLKGEIRRVIKLVDRVFGLGTMKNLAGFENKTDADGKPFNDIDGQLEFVKKLGEN